MADLRGALEKWADAFRRLGEHSSYKLARKMEAEVRAALSAPPEQPVPGDEQYYHPSGSLMWGHPIDVRHLILQLQTLPPHTKVSSVTHIPTSEGTKARAYGLSMSWERWGDDGWLDFRLPVDKCLAFWATEREKSKGVEGEAVTPPGVEEGSGRPPYLDVSEWSTPQLLTQFWSCGASVIVPQNVWAEISRRYRPALTKEDAQYKEMIGAIARNGWCLVPPDQEKMNWSVFQGLDELSSEPTLVDAIRAAIEGEKK